MWFYKLNSLDRKTLILLRVYEDTRRKKQRNYRVFNKLDETIISTSLFKTFRTVVKWLSDSGWVITWKECHWIGYVNFIFDTLKTTPHPGQLRNNKLLKDYILSMPKDLEVRSRSVEEMNELYKKILPEYLYTLHGVT